MRKLAISLALAGMLATASPAKAHMTTGQIIVSSVLIALVWTLVDIKLFGNENERFVANENQTGTQ